MTVRASSQLLIAQPERFAKTLQHRAHNEKASVPMSVSLLIVAGLGMHAYQMCSYDIMLIA